MMALCFATVCCFIDRHQYSEKPTTILPNHKCRITCQKAVQSPQTLQEPHTSIIIHPYQKNAKLWSTQSFRKTMFNPLWQKLLPKISRMKSSPVNKKTEELKKKRMHGQF